MPIAKQQPLLKKMCEGLNPKSVLLFTCGGGIDPREISGGFAGEQFDYSTPGVDRFSRRLSEFGCTCKHLEHDQYPENQACIIAQKHS